MNKLKWNVIGQNTGNFHGAFQTKKQAEQIARKMEKKYYWEKALVYPRKKGITHHVFTEKVRYD